MNQYEMVAIIVAVAVVGGVLKHVLAPRETSSADNQHHGANGGSKQQQDLQAQRLQQFENRLEVLEQIVTSDGYDLKQRFKELQDKQREKS